MSALINAAELSLHPSDPVRGLTYPSTPDVAAGVADSAGLDSAGLDLAKFAQIGDRVSPGVGGERLDVTHTVELSSPMRCRT